MIGHSTVLIEAEGQRILIDPFFETRGNLIYERIAPPAVAREALLDVQLVLVSHNHWDHIDREYFRLLDKTVPVVAPHYAVRFTRRQGPRNVIGLKTWECRLIGPLRVTAVPAIHDAIGAGFVLECTDQRLYFAGDTYYHDFMKEVGRRWKLDVALLPVASSRLPFTMGSAGAIRAIQDLMPKVVIPIHLGLRPRFAFLRTDHTLEGFARRASLARLETGIILLRDGEIFSVS
jgi:L-ascorbate metabolism protein UlaG (beta-lactamase superfamily)